ncbi:MAG: CoB--CoM heterodisulfide reductase iron-sulfur subunit A family protein [Acidobacteria bacterium]|nr:CoB--CoM heterodisulfide reductase iron-sulfur subunit A family protein [Acidobacteriota bacterium]
MIAAGSGDRCRIGVFVCHCGRNIAGYLDTAAVADYARTLPGVVYVSENHYSCSEPGMKEIGRAIREEDLTRVVVAACTPRTHEPLFRKTCADADLNPYLFEFVNIREQCSWVHSKDRAAATCKAMDLVRMGVAKAALLEPAEAIQVEVTPAALIIGGGVAGMTAAVSLARRGFPVCLVERKQELGGRLHDLNLVYPVAEKADDLRDRLQKNVAKYEKIEVLTGAGVTAVNGFIGHFEVEIEQGKKKLSRTVGTIIVATGADVLVPEGMYGYDGHQVITQLELEAQLRAGTFAGESVAMIQCAGARNQERSYCSKICCFTALKNAMQLKTARPEMPLYILYRDLQTHGLKYEAFLNEAREKGIQFVRYSADDPPQVAGGVIRVRDLNLNRELTLAVDIVVLSTPLVPRHDTRELSHLLRVPVGENGFLLEAHAQLRPVEFATDGVYICGAALWPADISESIFQAQAAAAKAAIPMGQGLVSVEPITCQVRPELCRGCGLCEQICEFHAPGLTILQNGTRVAAINEVLCKGCGTCAAMCPTNAIVARQFTDRQLLSMLTTALRDWHAPAVKE